MSTTIETHVEIDKDGRAWITGANTKVSEVVLDKLAYGWTQRRCNYSTPTFLYRKFMPLSPTTTTTSPTSIERSSNSSTNIGKPGPRPKTHPCEENCAAWVSYLERSPVHGRSRTVWHYSSRLCDLASTVSRPTIVFALLPGRNIILTASCWLSLSDNLQLVVTLATTS
jgi:hypothetical protein